MDEHRHHSGFFNGFILGLMVGAGLVFLFGTAKGKRVLQMLLEQVEENTQLSDLLEMPDEEQEYFDAIEDEEAVDEPTEEKEEVREVVHKPVAKIKRFFKGSQKKLVS